jgi:hypothetical protein
MFRIIQTGNSIPYSCPVDPSAEFEPGMIGQFKLIGNQVVLGVSDGSAPFGIIDDVKKKAFSAISVDEVVVTPHIEGVVDPITGKTVLPYDLKQELVNPNVSPASFVSKNVDVELTARNGVVTFLSGTELNYSLTGTGSADAIRTVVSYSYQIANIAGDDSTTASGKVTVWFDRMIVESDMIEANRRYPVNAPIFVSTSGLLTTSPVMSNYPAVGIVMAPPTAIHGSLQFLWL